MNLKEIIYKAANDYAAIEWDHIQTQIKAGLSPHVVSVTSEAFSAGADFGFRKAIELLREANVEHPMRLGDKVVYGDVFNREWADWLESQLEKSLEQTVSDEDG